MRRSLTRLRSHVETREKFEVMLNLTLSGVKRRICRLNRRKLACPGGWNRRGRERFSAGAR